MDIFAVTVLLLLLSTAHSEESKRKIVLTRTICHKNDKYVEKFTSPRKPVNRTTSITSVDIHFRPEVELQSPIYEPYQREFLQISFTTNKRFNAEYKPYMINIKYELCDILKFRNHPFFKISLEIANRSENNILDPCPLKGHRYVKPYYTSYDSIPIVPTGLWRLDIAVTIERDKKAEEIVRMLNFYEITET